MGLGPHSLTPRNRRAQPTPCRGWIVGPPPGLITREGSLKERQSCPPWAPLWEAGPSFCGPGWVPPGTHGPFHRGGPAKQWHTGWARAQSQLCPSSAWPTRACTNTALRKPQTHPAATHAHTCAQPQHAPYLLKAAATHAAFTFFPWPWHWGVLFYPG